MPKPLYRLAETSSPSIEPVTLAEAKAHLRITHSTDDALVTDIIKTARMACESFTGRAFITRNISLYLDIWPSGGGGSWWDGVREGASVMAEAMVLNIPRPPLFSVTDIRVYGADDTLTTFSSENYFVDTVGPQGRIVLKDSAAVPSPGRNTSGIEVRYTAGYGTTASAVPLPLREAVKQTVANFYENRGDHAAGQVLSPSVCGLLQPYRVTGLA